MTVREALEYGSGSLASHTCNGADAQRDAELLLVHVTGRSKEELAVHPDRKLAFIRTIRYRRLVARRKNHAPVAYLTGTAWFFGRPFSVTEDTLIPRPATETIVEHVLTAIPPDGNATVVDVGTGSGCISVTLAAERPDIRRCIATERDRHALTIAARNARTHKVDTRITFMKDDLIEQTREKIDSTLPVCIIANLPYIPDSDISTLDPDVREFEPVTALAGGTDGLDPSRTLIDQIHHWEARPKTDIFFELLPDQADTLIAYARKKIPGIAADHIRNLSGITIGVHLRYDDMIPQRT